MSFAQTVLLAAFAGVTIYLGLPVGRLRNLSANWQALLTAAAGGVILFLIFDVLSKAIEPVSTALDAARGGASTGPFVADTAVLAASVAFGLLSVTYVTTRLRGRAHGPSLTPWGSETAIRSRGEAVVLMDEAAEQVPAANVARTDRDRVSSPRQW